MIKCFYFFTAHALCSTIKKLFLHAEGFRDIEDQPDTGHTSSHSQFNSWLHLYDKDKDRLLLICHCKNNV
jgi:hypothetical protein